MMRKLRTLLAAALLVPALFSTANAFTTDGDSALNPSRSETCYIYWNGMWYEWEC